MIQIIISMIQISTDQIIIYVPFFSHIWQIYKREIPKAEEKKRTDRNKNYLQENLIFNLILQNSLCFKILLTAVPPFIYQSWVKQYQKGKKKVTKVNIVVCNPPSPLKMNQEWGIREVRDEGIWEKV